MVALLAFLLALCLPSVAPAQPLTISAHAVLSAFPAPVSEEPSTIQRPAPKWATALSIAMPLADGGSTCYAMAQSGPNAHISEGSAFHRWLFRGDVSCTDMALFKVGEAALMGWAIHRVGKTDREKAIGATLIRSALYTLAVVGNMRNASLARRLNR